MNTTANAAADQTDREIVFRRVFDAPRELVWQAWTDPAHIGQWWGPKGFGSTNCEVDLRVGGRFRLEMCAPDGKCYRCVGIYREIVAPERPVFESEADETHPCGAGLPPRSVATVSFAEQDGTTQSTLHTRFENASRRDAADQAGYSTSWGEALQRLAAHLH